MAWYWDVAIGVGLFNLVFVLFALLASMIRDRIGSSASASREEAYISHECILHFLQTMYLAENRQA